MKPTRASLTNQYLELEQELVISQCGWLTQPSLAAPYSRTAEEQERSRRLYEHIILFLQDNGLTTYNRENEIWRKQETKRPKWVKRNVLETINYNSQRSLKSVGCYASCSYCTRTMMARYYLP